MPFELLKHTEGAEMRVRGETQEELFQEALKGILGLMEPRIFHDNDAEADRIIEISAPDTTTLLIDFLGQALRLALASNELYERVCFAKLTETELEAELYGREVRQYDREIATIENRDVKISRGADGAWEAQLYLK